MSEVIISSEFEIGDRVRLCPPYERLSKDPQQHREGVLIIHYAGTVVEISDVLKRVMPYRYILVNLDHGVREDTGLMSPRSDDFIWCKESEIEKLVGI